MSTPASTPYDRRPTEALDAIASHNGPLLVDLDETLYLRNSTEDFVGHAWPAPLALLVLKVLDRLQPWRWTGGRSTRDVWRVLVLRGLFPWTAATWPARARRLAADATNRPLRDALNATGRPVTVITLGFERLVAPLVAAMGLRDARIVAMHEGRFSERAAGKLSLTLGSLGAPTLEAGLLVTDSPDDLEVLARCAAPFRVVWPQARFVNAFRGTYLPGRYLSTVKRPGTGYLWHGVVKEDVALWVLATTALAAAPLAHAIGLACLAVSFWAIYECGYTDNDRIAARSEASPKLSQAFFDAPVGVSDAKAWAWAAVAGAVGVGLAGSRAAFWQDAATWACVLAVTFWGFRLYNRVDKATRVWLFAGLQALRALAPLAVVAAPAIGVLALCAHVIARWMPYYVYRLTGRDFEAGRIDAMRLLFFTLLAAALAIADGARALSWGTAIALFGWMAILARHDLRAIARSAHRIDRTTPGRATPGMDRRDECRPSASRDAGG